MGLEQLTLIEKECLQVPPGISGTTLLAAGSLPLSSSVVVGMVLRERPPMFMRGYRSAKDEARRELELRASHARRFAEFFSVHMASRTDHVHDCEEIVRYVLGMNIVAVHSGGPWPPLEYTDADYHSLEMGKGYGIMDREGNPKNFVYGLDNPSLCLGSLGMGQPLFVAPTTAMMELHHSQRVGEIIPEH